MAFYTFSQNNSGGSFEYDDFQGITHHVIIEADNDREAIIEAERIGLYFNGCNEGRDCPCCGDRWSDWLDSSDGKEVPEVYGAPVSEPLDYPWNRGTDKYFKLGESVVHYKNGNIEWFN